MKKKRIKPLEKNYSELVRKLFKKDLSNIEDVFDICRDITIQITNSCNLCCSYCYEGHKTNEKMSLNTAKKIIDRILDEYEQGDGDFVNKNTKALVFDFIGGEPLLEAELIEHIIDYYIAECWKRKIPLAPFTRFSFATNGMLWFSPASQHLFRKYHDMMSVSVSIDGIQELHDMNRVDHNGMGSFSTAYRAFLDGKNKYGWYNNKMTFAQNSFSYIFDSVKFMINEGCDVIFCNYAYEPIYTEKDAFILYEQLKRIADYLIIEKPNAQVSMLDDILGEKYIDDKNYCGGTGKMIAFAPDGRAFPCIRYAPISVGEEKAAPMCLGDCKHGLYYTPEQKAKKAELDAITMTTQSSQECIDCPVSQGCGWCSGYNYEITGTPNKRLTNICLVHKARVLAHCYYYNKRYLEIGDCDPQRVNLQFDEASKLIGIENALEVYKIESDAFAS